MDMNFKQYYQPTNLTTDIHNANDSNQYTENEQTEFDKSRTNVIVSNHIKEYVPSTIISSTVSSSPIILNQTCNSNYDTINNNTVTKMTTVTNFPRNTTTNPIFNFWRNSTRRSGNWGSRTGTKKSFVWKYFFHPELNLGTKDLTHTQCILCDSLLAFNNSGTTTTMLNHLKSRHGEIVQQEYQQSKKSRCGLLTLKEMNKMTKLNYNLTSNSTKLIDWSNNLITSTSESLKSSSSRPPVPMTLSYTNEHNNPTLLSRRTHRGRPPGSYRHLDYSMANRKFNQIINNNNNNNNYPVKINNSNINKCGEKEGTKETEEINQLQTQIKVNACSPSYRLGNEKCTNSSNFLWSIPNMYTTLNNTQLYNTTLPLINNELLNSNDNTINQPIISSSNLNNHHHHNIQTSNLSNELLNELFNSINPISNIQLNLTKLTNLYINEYYKHINQQLLINNNNNNNNNEIFNQSIFNNYLNDTLKQQNFIHNNELQLNNLNINSLPITDFSIKSYQSLFIDTNEPLDLSLSTYKQKIEQEKLENILHLKSYNNNDNDNHSPIFMNSTDNNNNINSNNNSNSNSNEDWNYNSAFTKVTNFKESSLSKSPKQSLNHLIMKNESVEIQKNCTSTNTIHNEVNTDPINDNTGYFKSSSVISVDNESTNQHQGVEEFQLLNQKTDESIPSSSPYFINNYPLSCCSPSCEEFHYRLAYFLIRDFHPPRILEEEGFKILIGILWNKFHRINNDINYNIQFNFLPSSKLMENQILNNLYNQLKFNIDNKIKKLMILQQSIENQLLILPQITISLKYWSLNSVNKNQFNNDNLFFEYVDIELNFFINSQYIPKCNHIFYGTYEINKIQTLNEILKPCWNLIYSQFKTNYDYILSEWPIIILTNCLEYTLNAFKESCPISNYLILPYFNVYMKNAVQRALCIPEINEVLKNYQKSLQTLDENVQQMDDLSSESNLKSQSNDQTNINESLSDILDLITRIIPNMDRLPHFTDVDMNLINRIFKSIEIVQEIEKLCRTNYSHFTVSMILPILKNLYSINIEKINDNLSNQFYTTIMTYLKTIFNENNTLEEFLYISTFLDPRFKNSMNQNDYEHILHRLQTKISLLDDYVENIGLHRKMSYMDEFQYSINDYLNEKSININEDPIQWWNDQCDKSEKYYIFKILALYYLTIPLNILNNNNNTNIDDINSPPSDINSPPSDISSPSSDISSNYTQQQNINKLIEQFENSFQNENNSIQINMSKLINVDNNILKDNHISTVISTDYCKSNRSLNLWTRIGTKFIPIYRFLRKNWKFSENFEHTDEDINV
ncbi:unnamed protein product [Schistosoma bovis]|nr:unnamed protein product [Schistosoma bovis]